MQNANQMTVKFLNPNDNCYGEDAKFGLYLDDKQLAVMTVSFTDKDNCSTAEDFRSHVRVADDCYQLSPMHTSAIIQHTIMSNWEVGVDCFEDVFANGDLVVNPALYS